jgi:hypothetical protein
MAVVHCDVCRKSAHDTVLRSAIHATASCVPCAVCHVCVCGAVCGEKKEKRSKMGEESVGTMEDRALTLPAASEYANPLESSRLPLSTPAAVAAASVSTIGNDGLPGTTTSTAAANSARSVSLAAKHP